jgi:hypothetical protein
MDRTPFEKRLKALIDARTSWETGWKDIMAYICPTRGFFNESPGKAKEIDHKKIINNEATQALGTLTAGMASGLASPARPWFRLALENQDLMKIESVKLWLDDVQGRMMSVFAKSNIYLTLATLYEELGGFGTACAIILEDFQDVVRGRNFTAGEYYLGSGADGRVNTFGRVGWMTAGQLKEEFGEDNLPDTVKALLEKNQVDELVKFNHLIEPNDDRIPDQLDAKNMPYRSIYWVDGSTAGSVLRFSGFEEFPVISPRWNLTTTNSVYGTGPGHNAMGDVKMLQRMERDKLIGLAKLVDPPLQKDASVQGVVNNLPGGVTDSSATVPNAGVRPAYQVQPDLNSIENSIDKTSHRIRRTFFADLFLMISSLDKSGVTAREVAERSEEKLLAIAPILIRLYAELLDSIIDRTFAIMLRNRLLAPPPQELDGQEIKIEYISTLAQAQKMMGTTSIRELMGTVGEIAAANPGLEIMDNIDTDEVVNEIGENLGVSAKILRSPEKVAGIRQGRQKAIAMQQQAAAAAAMVDGAKTLSDTKLGNGSALDGLIKQAGAGK